MSFAHYTWTFSADPSDAPAAFSGADEVRTHIDAVWKQAAEGGGSALRVAHGSTRGGSALALTKRMTEALDLPGLGFLHGEGDLEFDTEASLLKVVILRDAERDRAAAELESAFAHLAGDPKLATELGDFLQAGDAIQGFARDYGAGPAVLDLNNAAGDDEGTSGEYLAAYWRSVLRVLRDAKLEGRVVVHVCELEGEFSLRGVELPEQGELRLPAQFLTAIPPKGDDYRVVPRVDIRLEDGRKFLGMAVSYQGVITCGIDPQGLPLPHPFEAGDIVEVRPARSGLKAFLGLW